MEQESSGGRVKLKRTSGVSVGLIRVAAVIDESDPFIIGDFEPQNLEGLLTFLRNYPLEHPDGTLCFTQGIRFCFGANGDRPHIEVLASSKEHLGEA